MKTSFYTVKTQGQRQQVIAGFFLLRRTAFSHENVIPKPSATNTTKNKHVPPSEKPWPYPCQVSKVVGGISRAGSDRATTQGLRS